MKIVLSHPTGNENSRQAARAFANAGVLGSFVTSLHIPSEKIPWKWLPGRLKMEVARRDFSSVMGKIIPVAKVREISRLASNRMGFPQLTESDSNWASVDSLYQAVDEAVSRMIKNDDSITSVYAYENGANKTFDAAVCRGVERIYELPIGYWREHNRICLEEAELNPDWAHTWSPSTHSQAKLERKDNELKLASRIIVPSKFVAVTLQYYPGIKSNIDVLPYGFPDPIDPSKRRWYNKGPLKVLFVGGLSQRKGLSYLLGALAPFHRKIELTIVGIGPGAEQAAASGAHLMGSLPRSLVLEIMRQSDVMIFPTLFEGLALVIGEAMSQGLPVITTPHSGAENLIENGVDGWIVPIRDSEAITAIVDECLQNSGLIKAIGTAALNKASSWRWQDYRKQLQHLVCN